SRPPTSSSRRSTSRRSTRRARSTSAIRTASSRARRRRGESRGFEVLHRDTHADAHLREGSARGAGLLVVVLRLGLVAGVARRHHRELEAVLGGFACDRLLELGERGAVLSDRFLVACFLLERGGIATGGDLLARVRGERIGDRRALLACL